MIIKTIRFSIGLFVVEDARFSELPYANLAKSSIPYKLFTSAFVFFNIINAIFLYHPLCNIHSFCALL